MHITKEMEATIRKNVKSFIASGMPKKDIITYIDGYISGFVDAHPLYRQESEANFFLMRYNYMTEFNKQWGKKHGKK